MVEKKTASVNLEQSLVVKGAREHNLKNVDLQIPRNKMVVFSGLSGSGKSSLAFDTIFAEGQRRYVESLSSYARQFLGQMDKPDVDFIEGLSPAVSIDQKSTSHNPRSTVGTITEVYDYLRLLYARAGVPHCPECGEQITAQSSDQIVQRLLTYPEKTRLQIIAPVIRGRKGEYQELFSQFQAAGYTRGRVDGTDVRFENPPILEKQLKHDVEVIVDRIVIRDGIRTRLAEAVENSIELADGLVVAEFVDEEPDSPRRFRRFSQRRACPNDHELTLNEIEPRTFSFNAPYGACPTCSGLGSYLEVDPELVVQQPELSVREGAIQPWPSSNKYRMAQLEAVADDLGFDLEMPYQDLPAKVQKILMYGHNYKVKMTVRTRWGKKRLLTTGFEGAVNYIKRKHQETTSDVMRDRYEGYMRDVPCQSCLGARLKPEVLAVRFGDKNIAELCQLSIAQARDFLKTVELTGSAAMIAGPVLKEIQVRLEFLLDVGLSYLSLARSAATLSGGEAQRIRLATQIGSALVGVLYVLDEPSIGLHQRDNQRLIETLLKLRDLGNTLIVVEHDEDTIKAADWIVDIGPRAGINGGKIVYSGPVEGITACKESLTGQYLAKEREIEIPPVRRLADPDRQLQVIGARENNLKNVDVSIPLGNLVVVTGVSGSGKSTLVNQVLYQALARKLQRAKLVPGRHKGLAGVEHLDKVIHVDQSPIGRNPRSNPATYTGVWDHIRQLFAQTPEAKIRGYQPGRFSFNVKGGRCESCRGDGTIKISMNFLPDVYVPCEVCRGRRYNQETLQVTYRGKNVAEVLDMSIAQAAEFFQPITQIARHLNTLVEVGLGYLRLGQSATTLSGGEAQRVKLASELQKRSRGRSIYVLDEPTTGLHLEDIRKLMLVLQGLVDKGNTVVVIEHNLDVIKCADWIIDMGPDGGDHGGEVVVCGTPETVAKCARSYTGQFLASILEVEAENK